MIRAFDAGKPVAVSGYAQFAEYPDSCVGEDPVRRPARSRRSKEFLTADFDVERSRVRSKRQWLDENATLDLAVDGYAKAVESIDDRESRPSPPPQRGRRWGKPDEGVVHTNRQSKPRFRSSPSSSWSDSTSRATTSASPSATSATRRAHAHLRRAGVQDRGQALRRRVVRSLDRWLSLPGDLVPGATTTLTFPVLGRSGRYSLRLYDGLQSIPSVEPKPWAAAEIAL